MRGPSETELDALMNRLADGDRTAFTPLFEALYPRALTVARRRLDQSDAEDAAQKTMTAVFARAIEFSKGRPLLPWFYAIAANETHALARRIRTAKARDVSTSSLESMAAADDDPEHALSLVEMRVLLREAIAELDPASSAAIEAQLASDHDTHSRSPAMRKRISRAYGKLRSLLLGGPSRPTKVKTGGLT